LYPQNETKTWPSQWNLTTKRRKSPRQIEGQRPPYLSNKNKVEGRKKSGNGEKKRSKRIWQGKVSRRERRGKWD
jgi:hypothetical protein